jgi:hypothetical protein
LQVIQRNTFFDGHAALGNARLQYLGCGLQMDHQVRQPRRAAQLQVQVS